MPFYEKRTYCGPLVEIEQYESIRPAGPGKRSKNQKASSEAQKKINNKNSKKTFALMLNANFRNGDVHAMLTFALKARQKPPTPEQLSRIIDSFLDRLRAQSKKIKTVLKYMLITEYKDGIPHLHLVVSGVPAETVRQCWDKGICKITWLYSEPDFTALAQYLAKQFNPEHKGRRWRASRNIERPRVERRRIKRITSTQKAMLPPELRKEYRVVNWSRECSEITGESLYMLCERIERDKSPPGGGGGKVNPKQKRKEPKGHETTGHR